MKFHQPGLLFSSGGSLHAENSENRSGQVLFTLNGRIETEGIKQVEELLAAEISGQQLIWDLKSVTLVNQDAVQFSAAMRPMASSWKIVLSTSERGSVN